jgi:hypothetical protein
MAKLEGSFISTAWPVILTFLGASLVVWGVVLGSASKTNSALTPELVQQYNDAGKAFEEASVVKKRQQAGKEMPQSAEEAHPVETALARLEAAKTAMEEAKNSRASTAFWLKLSGGILALVGVGSAMMGRS